VVVIDSPIRERTPEEEAAASQIAFGPLRVYPTAAEAIRHFRTVPEQPNSLPFVMEHIAERSIREVDGGWSWKFDTGIFGRPRPSPQMLTQITCRVALLRAEFGLLTESIGQHMYELLGRTAPVVEIPLAGHHVMLDRPISLVTALRTLLADWEHSLPQRPAD
jgi:pimeloyl-ACP methyl ester carboxylesterase